MDELGAFPALLTSVALGLLMGLERQRRPGANAGVRTFALVGMAGAICALLAREAGLGWLVPAVALALVLMMSAADLHRSEPEGAPDATTTVALLLCFLFGALLGFGFVHVAVSMALIATALLYFKDELHDATRRLTRQDIVSVLQFVLITFVILPLLPDRGYGPYERLNPYEIWLMVVLTSGLSLVGYVVLRLAREGQGIPLLGILGGLVSSTATTLVFARMAGRDPKQVAGAIAVILIANAILLVRIGVLAAFIAPASLPLLGAVLALGLATGIAWPLHGWVRMALSRARGPVPELGNPANLGNALAFGLVYGIVVMLMAALHEQAGALGVYAVAAVSGLTDMDAQTISTLQLFASEEITAAQAVRAIVIALGANMAFKCGLVLLLAGRTPAARIGLNYLATYGGLLAGVFALG